MINNKLKMDIINNKEAPTIDAVEVVRGECKWYKAHMMPKTVKCLIYSKDDDYCSYGERNERTL